MLWKDMVARKAATIHRNLSDPVEKWPTLTGGGLSRYSWQTIPKFMKKTLLKISCKELLCFADFQSSGKGML